MTMRTMIFYVVCLIWNASVFAVEVPPAIFKPKSVILFQGDSITHGGRLGDMNHYLGHGYQAEIAMRYLAYYPNDGLQFANRGESGHTSSNLVIRWARDAFPFKVDEKGYRAQFSEHRRELVPDYLSLLIGVNDHGSRRNDSFVSAEDYEKNLHYMVTNALAYNPRLKIVLCEPFYLPKYDENGVSFTDYQEAARRVAEQYNLVFVPFQKFFSEDLLAVNPNTKYWCWDCVHPTYAAHMRMADFWIATAAKGFAEGKGSPNKNRAVKLSRGRGLEN